MHLQDMTEPELRRLMNDCAKALNTKLAAACGAEKPMFVLLVFNDPAVSQYISTCDRSTIPTALREAATRLELRQDIPR